MVEDTLTLAPSAPIWVRDEASLRLLEIQKVYERLLFLRNRDLHPATHESVALDKQLQDAEQRLFLLEGRDHVHGVEATLDKIGVTFEAAYHWTQFKGEDAFTLAAWVAKNGDDTRDLSIESPDARGIARGLKLLGKQEAQAGNLDALLGSALTILAGSTPGCVDELRGMNVTTSFAARLREYCATSLAANGAPQDMNNPRA